MEANTTADNKRIVERLNYGAKTAKRVGWESWEFTVCGPHQIEVTSASWGCERDDHAYVVCIKERDGVPVPAECGCKADQYNEEVDCKHKVSLASIGGLVVLQAAVEYANPTDTSGRTPSTTLADRLRADGGLIHEKGREDAPRLIEPEHEVCANGNQFCAGPNGDTLPCFECFAGAEGR